MMRAVLICASLACGVHGYAKTEHRGCEGIYHLRISQELKTLAQLQGRQEPCGTLRLESGHRFTFETLVADHRARRRGKFELDDSHIDLRFDNDDRMAGDYADGHVTIEGLCYERADDDYLTGNWTVHKDGVEDRSIRMSFTKDGKFCFACVGARSEGKYEVHDGILTLLWTKIDDEAVEPGTVKKQIELPLDGVSFDIDRYHYERASKS